MNPLRYDVLEERRYAATLGTGVQSVLWTAAVITMLAASAALSSGALAQQSGAQQPQQPAKQQPQQPSAQQRQQRGVPPAAGRYVKGEVLGARGYYEVLSNGMIVLYPSSPVTAPAVMNTILGMLGGRDLIGRRAYFEVTKRGDLHLYFPPGAVWPGMQRSDADEGAKRPRGAPGAGMRGPPRGMRGPPAMQPGPYGAPNPYGGMPGMQRPPAGNWRR